MLKYTYAIFSLCLLTSTYSFASFSLTISSSDLGLSPSFSNVETFALDIQSNDVLTAGSLYADFSIGDIQYSVSGSLDDTPSGFPAFGFQLNHLFSSSPPITGSDFYALNPDSVAGTTISFQVSSDANLLDGLQLDELDELPFAQFGNNVIFHFNGREQDTGRYHPMFLQLKSDGTGILQNADNMGGLNPFDGLTSEIDVDFGDEYITNLSFDPSAVTLAVPEPQTTLLTLGGLLITISRRRRLSETA